MAALVLVRRGSEYMVEEVASPNVPAGISPEERRKIIDEEIYRMSSNHNIAELQDKIRALKLHRNELSSVSRLPDELLVEIWEYLAYSRPQSKDWLSVTHVCSRWQQVALDSPTLWQEPLFGTEEMTEEMIRRSRNTALSFEITFQASRMLGAHTLEYNQRRIKTVQEQMDRIKSLSLDCLPIALEFKSAPLLTKLSITYSLTEGYPFFINFFRGSCPNLTHVTLTECLLLKYPELIQPLPRVTDLSIYSMYRVSQASFQQVIASLKRFPNLRKLLLQDVFEDIEPKTEVDTQHDLRNLRFPKLETLRVNTEIVISRRFLDLTYYPTSTNVWIHVQEWGSRRDLNSLIGRFNSSPRSLIVDFESKERYNFSLESPKDASKPRGGRLTLQSRLNLLNTHHLPILHELHSLDFLAPAISTSESSRALVYLPLLEILRLECDQPDFLKILALPDSTNDGPVIRPYFPSLRTLILHDNPHRHELFAQYSGGRNTGLTMAFAEECRRVAKVRKEKYHEMFEYKVLVI